MPNTDKVSSNWNSHTTGGGEIGTTSMENYLAATTKAQQMYGLAIPFPGISQQKDFIYVDQKPCARMFKATLFKIALNIHLFISLR